MNALTINDAAKQLSVSRVTVYALIERGLLASLKIGRCRRILQTDLDDYLQRCRRPVKTAS